MSARKFINGFLDKENMFMLFRNEDGQLMKKVLTAEHIAYFKQSDLTPDIRRAVLHSIRVLEAKDEGEWLRVAFQSGYWNPDKPNKWRKKPGCWVSYREEVCKHWEKEFGLKSYEADVSAIRRWISDTDAHIARPRRCYLDIETDSRAGIHQAKEGKARILCWAIVSESGEKYSGLLNEDSDADECRILSEMWDVADQFDQIVAWNGDGFDFPVIKARTKKVGARVKDVRRWLYLDHMLCFKRNNTMSAESGDEKQSFKLDDIASSLLGEGKHDVDGSKTWQYWAAGGESRQKLLEYNIQDTDLMRRIEQKTGYLELFQTLCEVCRVFPESKSLKPTQQVDGFMLRLGVEKGVHFSTKWYGDESEVGQFRGAYVMQPRTSGITKNVHVGDFASLYPSIMVTWNLSPDTKIGFGDKAVEGQCWSPSNNLLCDSTKEGILSTALQELIGLRAEWNKKRASLPPGTPEAKEAERRTNAYKTAANSFYGVMGTQYSRYYDRDISEATTQNGVWLIKKTNEVAEARGMNVIYTDTDSLFVCSATKDEFDEFVNWCNAEFYPKLLAECGCRVNKIKLAYEKEFERLIFVAAKKYCGSFAHYKGKAATADSKPEIKGLEFKRGDTNKIARSLQREIIELLMRKHERPEDFHELLDTYKQRVLTDTLPLELVVTNKQITKELDEYVSKKKLDGTDTAVLAHVQVARKLADAGEDITVGSRIGYVVVDGESQPIKVISAADYSGECDRFYLWETQIFPPTMRLLQASFPESDWSSWESVRPKRPRAKRSKAKVADVNQMNMFAAYESQACTIYTSRLVQDGRPILAPAVKGRN